MNALGTMILHNTKPDFKDKRMLLASLLHRSCCRCHAALFLPMWCMKGASAGCGRFSLRQASAALIGLYVGLNLLISG